MASSLGAAVAVRSAPRHRVDAPVVATAADLALLGRPSTPAHDLDRHRRLLAVADGRIAYYVDDPGPGVDVPAIVWLHGLPLDARAWDAQRAHFHGRSRNVFVDLRGCGASDRIPAGTRDVTGLYVADLKRLFDRLDLHGDALVGFGVAGHVGLRFAALYPDAVGRLVVINGSPRFRRGAGWPWGIDDAGIRQLDAAWASGGPAGLIDAMLDPGRVLRDVTAVEVAVISARFRAMAARTGAATLTAFLDGISRDDDRDLLPAITAATLLVTSPIGREVPPEVGLYLRHHIAASLLAEIPGADHFVFATRPRLVNLLLDQFLLRHAPLTLPLPREGHRER
ncbi:alpha/beta fold hydrolase [Pseudonocardia sp. GCM10023141]|uniref:alpha/beta fold hydrolase n=1 Tax=Pseudonocardia sp. GCM10023141 TaxID=3252653 RepID=UPI0036092A14